MPMTIEEAVRTLDEDIHVLSARVLEKGIEIFTSVEEYEPSTFWEIRVLFIELRKAQQIRESLAGALNGDSPEKHPEAPPAAGKRRRKKAG